MRKEVVCVGDTASLSMSYSNFFQVEQGSPLEKILLGLQKTVMTYEVNYPFDVEFFTQLLVCFFGFPWRDVAIAVVIQLVEYFR